MAEVIVVYVVVLWHLAFLGQGCCLGASANYATGFLHPSNDKKGIIHPYSQSIGPQRFGITEFSLGMFAN